ncbi:TIGR03089 family protein [Nocardioides sp. P5_C9_2]
MTTFDAVLRTQLRHEPGRPLVTWYDQASGERVELSVTTYANWVAKAAGLLVEEGDLERGMRLRIDLPTHWLAPVFLGAAWTVGLVVTSAEDPDAVVCGPDTLGAWVDRGDDLVVLACSLLPFGVRFAEAVPAGVHDVGLEIWSQPDAFTPWDPPTGADAATDGDYGDHTQGALMEAAAAGSLLTDGGRLLSVANPASPPGIATFTEPLVRGGSLVLVRHPDPALLDATYAAERATHRAGQPGA